MLPFNCSIRIGIFVSAQKASCEIELELGAKPPFAMRTLCQYRLSSARRVMYRMASSLPSNPQPETNNACELAGSSPTIEYGFVPNQAFKSLLGSATRTVLAP